MSADATADENSLLRWEEEFRRIERRSRRRHRLGQLGRLLAYGSALFAATWGAPVFTEAMGIDTSPRCPPDSEGRSTGG
jgi:hypothetical protein